MCDKNTGMTDKQRERDRERERRKGTKKKGEKVIE